MPRKINSYRQNNDLFTYFDNNNNGNKNNGNKSTGNQNNNNYQTKIQNNLNTHTHNSNAHNAGTRNSKRKNDISPSTLRFESKLDAILSKMNDFTSNSARHEQQIKFLYHQGCDHEQRINDLEQSKLDSVMDIAGLKLNASTSNNAEAARLFVFNYLKDLGHNLELFEIADATVFKGTKKNGESYEIVRTSFIHSGVKRRIMKLKLNSHPVYFSHALTKMNRQLLLEAKRLRKSNIIHSAWTMDGRIFVKKEANDAKVRVLDNEHLASFIGIADDQIEHDDTLTDSSPNTSTQYSQSRPNSTNAPNNQHHHQGRQNSHVTARQSHQIQSMNSQISSNFNANPLQSNFNTSTSLLASPKITPQMQSIQADDSL